MEIESLDTSVCLRFWPLEGATDMLQMKRVLWRWGKKSSKSYWGLTMMAKWLESTRPFGPPRFMSPPGMVKLWSVGHTWSVLSHFIRELKTDFAVALLLNQLTLKQSVFYFPRNILLFWYFLPFHQKHSTCCWPGPLSQQQQNDNRGNSVGLGLNMK